MSEEAAPAAKPRWWRRHPWWSVSIALLAIIALLAGLGYLTHRSGLRRLEATIARHRAEGHGALVEDAVHELPRRDATAQERAWKVMSGSPWPMPVPDLLVRIRHDGAAWQPGAAESALLGSSPAGLAELRTLLRGDEVLFTAVAARADGLMRGDQVLVRNAVYRYASWLGNAAVLGDDQALADLDHAQRSFRSGADSNDGSLAWSVTRIGDQVRLELAVMGALDEARWRSWADEPGPSDLELRSAIRTERLLLGSDALGMLAWRGLDPYHSFDRWLHGAADLAETLDALLLCEQGQTPATRARGWLRPDDWTDSERWLGQINVREQVAVSMRTQHRLDVVAAGIAIAARRAELPATSDDLSPGIRALCQEPRITYQRRSRTCFAVWCGSSANRGRSWDRIWTYGWFTEIDLDQTPP